MLLETITTKDVQIGLHASDWEDAIRQAVDLVAVSGILSGGKSKVGR